MTNTELEKWHHEVYWPLYKTMCRTPFPTKWDGGVRGKSLERLRKLKPSTELRERIISSVQAQMSHRKKLYQKLGSMQAWDNFTKYKTFYCNRASDAWLNQNGWDDEIPDIQDDTKQNIPTGRLCRCGRPSLGPQIGKCAEHAIRSDEKELQGYRRKAMENLGLLPKEGESKQEYYDRCRTEAVKRLKGMGL